MGQSTAVEDPPLQDFLDFPDIDLNFMETDAQWLEFQELCWPETQGLGV